MNRHNTSTERRTHPIANDAVTAGTVPLAGRLGDDAAGTLVTRVAGTLATQVADQPADGTDRTPVRRSGTHGSHSQSVPGGIAEKQEGDPDR